MYEYDCLSGSIWTLTLLYDFYSISKSTSQFLCQLLIPLSLLPICYVFFMNNWTLPSRIHGGENTHFIGRVKPFRKGRAENSRSPAHYQFPSPRLGCGDKVFPMNWECYNHTWIQHHTSCTPFVINLRAYTDFDSFTFLWLHLFLGLAAFVAVTYFSFPL